MTTATWNVLIYANAGDDVNEERMRGEIAGIRNTALPQGCHVAVQFNTATVMERHWISNGTYRMDPGEPVDTSEGSELTCFIDTATTELGRRPTMLILAAHGAGLDDVGRYAKLRTGVGLLPAPPRLFYILRGSTLRWGPDPNNGKFLTNIAIREAISDSTLQRVQLLGFNACWMAMLEIAFEMRDVAETFVASQVLAVNWPYGTLIARLAADATQSPGSWAAAIVDVVRAEIAAGRRDDAVSAFRTGRLTDVADAVGVYARRAMALIDTQWPALSDAINNGPRGVDDSVSADLALLVAGATCGDAQAENAARAVRDALTAARIANAADDSAHPGVTGLSIYCPRDIDIDLEAAYRGMAFQHHRWAAFLEKFQARQAEEFGDPEHRRLPIFEALRRLKDCS